MTVLIILGILVGLFLIAIGLMAYGEYLAQNYGVGLLNVNIIFTVLSVILFFIGDYVGVQNEGLDLNSYILFTISGILLIVSLIRNIFLFKIIHGIIVTIIQTVFTFIIIFMFYCIMTSTKKKKRKT